MKAILLIAAVTALVYAGEPDPVLNAAMALLANGKIERAEHLFYTVLIKDPDNPVALHEAGKLLIKSGNAATGYDFLRRALRQADATRARDIKGQLSGAGAPALALQAALSEYQATLEKIVNADNNELTREAALERLKPLGLEIKITARDKGLLAFATVELRQPLTTPVVTLAEGSSRLMNFQESYTSVPWGMFGLKYNQIRHGEGQQPALKCIQGGKVFLLVTEDTAKRVKAEKTMFTIKSGAADVNVVYVLNVTAGQTVLFKDQAIVFAADVVVKTK